MSRFLLLLPVLCLIGCGKSGFVCESGEDCDSVGDTFGPGVQPIEVKVSDFTYSYTAKSWHYDVTLQGLGEEVTVEIYDLFTEPKKDLWYEKHLLKQGEYDPQGAWDKKYADLEIVFDWADQEDGVSTMFSGDLEPSMSWMITAWNGGVAVNCFAAAGPQGDITYWDSYGCDQ